MKSYKINKYNKKMKTKTKNNKNNKKYRIARKSKKNMTSRRNCMTSRRNVMKTRRRNVMKTRRRNVMKTRKIKGGAGESFVRHFKNIENRKRAEARRLEEEQRILDEEKFYDEKQRKLDKFITTFKNDECTICLEDLDDDKNKTKMEKCLSCLDKKNKKLYFTDCEHTFHGRCLDKWLEENENCPLCREYIKDIQYSSEYPGR